MMESKYSHIACLEASPLSLPVNFDANYGLDFAV